MSEGPLDSIRRHVATVYTALVYFNSVVTLSAGDNEIANFAGELGDLIDCFTQAKQYEYGNTMRGHPCPLGRNAGEIQALTRLTGRNSTLQVQDPDGIQRRLRGWLNAVRQAFDALKDESPLTEATVARINAVYEIPGFVTAAYPDIRQTVFLNNDMYIDEWKALNERCRRVEGFADFYNASHIQDVAEEIRGDARMQNYAAGMMDLWKEIFLFVAVATGFTQVYLRDYIVSPVPLISHYANHQEIGWVDRFLVLWRKLGRYRLANLADGTSSVDRARQCFLIYRSITTGEFDETVFWDNQRELPMSQEVLALIEQARLVRDRYNAGQADPREFLTNMRAMERDAFQNNQDPNMTRYLRQNRYISRGDFSDRMETLEIMSTEVFTSRNCPPAMAASCRALHTAEAHRSGLFEPYLAMICSRYCVCLYLYNHAISNSEDGNWPQAVLETARRVVGDHGINVLRALDGYTDQINPGFRGQFMYAENLIRNMVYHFAEEAQVGTPIADIEPPYNIIYVEMYRDTLIRCITDAVDAYNSMFRGDYNLTNDMTFFLMPREIQDLIDPDRAQRERQDVDMGGGGGLEQQIRTHTDAVEHARVNRMNFRHEENYGDRPILRYYKERPPEQLATAMLGTACTGDQRAPGCYQIPGRTNVPCTDPNLAVTGMCNFKTIPVPWENPVGNSQAFKVYQALDVGAQIKLQLQRALIRYGYAAATLPVYCGKVLDRHFSVFSPPPGTPDLFANQGIVAVELARMPQIWMGNVIGNIEATNAVIASMEPQNSAAAAAGVNDTVRGLYYMLCTNTILVETDRLDTYIARNICPHYSRVLPRDTGRIPAELQEAFKADVPAEYQADATGKPNNFYRTSAPVPDGGQDPNFYVPYPIYYAIPQTLNVIPNRAYLNEKYIGPGSEAKRQLMINRASGMLLRSMQHLRNAMVLYYMAATRPLNTRFTEQDLATMDGIEIMRGSRRVLQEISNSDVPKGAMAFLTEADKNAMIALYKALLAAYPDNTNVGAPEVGLFKQLTENDDMRNPDGSNVIGSVYKHSGPPFPPQGQPLTPDEQAARYKLYKRVAYLEVLWSYWYDNNAMGKLRKRMNFRAKLAVPAATIASAAASMDVVKNVTHRFNVSADILTDSGFGWYDAALRGLVIAHLRAYIPPPSTLMEDTL